MTVERLSLFSPQRTAPEDLERILVGRDGLLQGTMAKIRNSATTRNKHHRLLVGPRGIGKTHLLSLINHRVSLDELLMSRLRVAWLNEDETSSNFLQLLLRIYRSLSARYPEQYSPEDLQRVKGTNPEDARSRMSESLVQRTGKHTILLLIENLDAHFAKFSVEEQRRWRGFFQDHPIFTTVATAQRLFDGMAKQDEPFYGFFDTHHLSPLTLEQTVEMLKKIATLTDDDELQQILETKRGRSRLQVIHYLAGGNPRLYVLLAELITQESLDDVVQAFEVMVDRQLTSFYQERVRWLAPLQQDIVHVLCRQRAAVSVKDIAQELYTSNQSISKQLGELHGYGYVRANKDGRKTRYELAEPLMRLVLEVKETDSQEPMRLLVEFLQAWFERSDLESRLASHACNGPGRKYLEAAVNTYDLFQETWADIGIRDRPIADEAGQIETVTSKLEQKLRELYEQGTAHLQAGDTEDAIADFTAIIEMPDAPAVVVVKALLHRGLVYSELGDTLSAITDCTAILEIPDIPDDLVAWALLLRGIAYSQLDDIKNEIADYTLILEMPDIPAVPVAARALLLRGIAYGQLGDTGSEIADYTAFIKMKDTPADQIAMAFISRGLAYSQLGDSRNAIADYTAILERPDASADQVAKVLILRGIEFRRLGDTKCEIADFTALIEGPDAPANLVGVALVKRSATYVRAGALRQALVDITKVINYDLVNLRQMIDINRSGFCREVLYILSELSDSDRGHLSQKLLQHVRELHIEESFGNALVEQLASLKESQWTAERLHAWNRLWQELGTRVEALIVPLRLLSAGIEYLATKNESALLDLPLEERRIVREALGLD